MNKARVIIIRCDTYEDEQVLTAIQKGFDMLGGISVFIKHGERIVLKPNILIGTDPDKGVTTHPAVFRAVGKLLKEAGASVLYGDSPSFGKAEPNLKKSGIKEVGDELGFIVANFNSGRTVSHRDALLVKRFVVANGVLDSDGLVSLSKFKHTGLFDLPVQ